MRFAHTNIVSTNWRALVSFYEQTFDCKIVPPIRHQSGDWLDQGTGLQGAKLEGAHLLLPGHGEAGPTLEIYQYEKIHDQDILPPNARGFGHLAFEVESVPEVLQAVENNGGSVQGVVTQHEVPGVGEISFVYARDPEGNLLELQSWKRDSD